MIVRVHNDEAVTCDWTYYNGDQVWDTTANAGAGGWVTPASPAAFATDYATKYRNPSTPTGGGWEDGTAPDGTTHAELRYRGADFAASYPIGFAFPDVDDTGDGDVSVNHDYGGTDNYRVMVGGTPVDGAKIEAYLAADTSFEDVIARTYTGSDGRWVAPLKLDADEYKLVISKAGVLEENVVDLEVT